jgi:hypothetical protein
VEAHSGASGRNRKDLIHNADMEASVIDSIAGTSIDLKDGDIGRTARSSSVDREFGNSEYIRPKGLKVCRIQLPTYRSPIVQTFIIALAHSLVVRL